MDKSNVRYEDEKSFRQAVEKHSRVSLTDAEWLDLLQGWHVPFDGLDYAEMVDAVRKTPIARPTESKARGYRLAHVQRAADEAKEMVESFRLDLFGHIYPPFLNPAGSPPHAWGQSGVRAN